MTRSTCRPGRDATRSASPDWPPGLPSSPSAARGASCAGSGPCSPPAPRSLLPEEIERAVEDLGPDAGAVRARLEHEFAAYLDANRQDRARTDATRTLLRAFDTIVGTVSKRAARVLTERLFAAGTERRDR